MQIDEIDRLILNTLLEDGDIPSAEIAKRIGVSAGTVHLRLKNLRNSGLILGSKLNIDYALLGYDTIAFIAVYLKKSSLFYSVVKRLKEFESVVSADYITGPFNILLKVICKDNNELFEVLQDQIQEIEGVEKTETFLGLYNAFSRMKNI